MRNVALILSGCCVLLFAAFAPAQQADIMVGGSTLMPSSTNNDSVNFQPPTEKGGTYLDVGINYVRFKHHLGVNAETAWRYHRANYPGNSETYRPILTDVNVLFQPQVSKNKKFGLDLFAGVGVASNRFNIQSSCGIPGCINYTSSNHFMEDLGGGLRYYVWHRLPNVFVRPEVHYYHIQNNVEFSSANVFRLGASIGYTFGSE
ncbi:MAG TPA: outer membrane beta-barrel protein [Candidatus Dormibacteraeota bacterium]|nr:outer membrane beta-barrel protein [Candidatus Dormibacteraeota bacterium]